MRELINSVLIALMLAVISFTLLARKKMRSLEKKINSLENSIRYRKAKLRLKEIKQKRHINGQQENRTESW